MVQAQWESPSSLVHMIIKVIEPSHGKVFGPAFGSTMLVQRNKGGRLNNDSLAKNRLEFVLILQRTNEVQSGSAN